MTIEMYCDRCGELVPADFNGGCRVRIGKSELSFHLCSAHQVALRHLLTEFCADEPPRSVQPSLKGD